MRVVIDTNLIVSYLLTAGANTSRLIEAWEQGRFIYLISPQILDELRAVVYRPRLLAYMSSDPAVLLELVQAEAEMVPGQLHLEGVCRDPKDDKFIGCAVEGQADFIVTGDQDLLELGEYDGIQIIRLSDFIELTG